jgi:[NiFe] hydrogenase diaphorase moiety large subunit
MNDTALSTIIERHGSDRTRLLDILWDVQHSCGHIPETSLAPIGAALGISPLDVLETASFYHFYLLQPAGKYQIYLCNSVLAKMSGYDAVRASLEQETGARFGQIDPDATFNLFETPCIGLSDQEPAMLIAGLPFTRLRPDRVADIIAQLKGGRAPADIVNPTGMGTDTLEYVSSLVQTNVRTKRPMFFRDKLNLPSMLARMLQGTPQQVIDEVVAAKLRGRGGAGFSTGLKWRLCRDALGNGAGKVVICNADEGEPGTFKDRVLLTRSPKQVFFGMVAAAYAIGAETGIVYLRYEYVYLLDYLNAQLQQMRDQGLLGRNIGGQAGFDFDIRIQLGAGAYICGDESALIESCEGKRGTPRIKPPFPVHSGFLGRPTSVNNVETLACVSHILAEGADWFRSMGTPESSGTRLLSVAGDCSKPGIYEVEWGTSVKQILAMVGATNAYAVQVSGPSGECISVAKDNQRTLGYEDLSCNGAFTIFDRTRDMLSIVRDHMQFFVDESCGICVPCRAGNVDLLHKVDRVITGRACQQDLDEAVQWGETVRKTSRCGLGGTSPKAMLTVLDRFPELFQAKLVEPKGPLLPSFDHHAALTEHSATALAVKQRTEASA